MKFNSKFYLALNSLSVSEVRDQPERPNRLDQQDKIIILIDKNEINVPY